MEHGAGDVVATFFAGEALASGRTVALGEAEAHHVRVRRVAVGARVRLVDGAGGLAAGILVRVSRHQALVELDEAHRVEPPPEIHLLVPIADRERMLWAAEKCTELGIASWRPVSWRRSRSVSPRGEGIAFQAKVRARMVSALTQSGGAWLPTLYPDATVERAIAAAPTAPRLLLDIDGDPLASFGLDAPVTIAVGPEGGVEPGEREQFVSAGFQPVRLAGSTLRFETAAIVACGVVRAALDALEARERGGGKREAGASRP